MNPQPESWSQFIHTILNEIDIISLVFIVVLIYMALVLRRWQRDKSGDHRDFDLADTIMENGRVSKDAMFKWGAFIATTFVMLHQEYKNVVTDWYVMAYLAAWTAMGIARIVKGTPDAKP